MRTLHTEITINAPAEKVWPILMAFDAYPDWNPFIKSLTGRAVSGMQLKVVMQPPGSKPMTFKPKCLVVRENSEFRWKGSLPVPGMFTGEHIFELHEDGNGRTKFVHRENFRGLLVPLLWKQLDTKTRAGFEAMNAALKEQAEKE